MKIAILSMQRIVNNGSVLQAYSLREIIREIIGVTADFLDIEDQPSLPGKHTVRDSMDYESAAAMSRAITQRAKRRIIRHMSARAKDKIRAFMRDELHLRSECSNQEYDVCVIGSDEVFNHTHEIRLQLHGEVRQAKKVISYAACCGSALPEDVRAEDLPRLKKAMQNFSALSVRDSATEKYVAPLYDGTPERHLDPVLVGNLHRRTPRKVPFKKYLLVYAYGQRIRSAEEISAIRDFARKKGLKTVAIGGSQFWCDAYVPVSPMRALDYFAHADYVITDTFHGSIFSVINHRRFAVIMRKTNSGKLTSLLQDLGLADRCVSDLRQLENTLCRAIDYAPVDAKLAQERIRTREYLKRQLLPHVPDLVTDPAACTGCGACAQACPKQAITMQPDADGCVMPQIDAQKCVGCGLCLRLCKDRGALAANFPLNTYAAVGKDDALVKNSASGGMFATLARSLIADGGAVAGAVMQHTDAGLTVKHALGDTPEAVRAMQGSKYVQSDAAACYGDVLQALKTGKTVLFSGTPCQVAAVKQLSGDPENLITMDLICHGTPPVRMLREFAEIMGRRLGGTITHINFRDKSAGKAFYARLDVQRGKRIQCCSISSNMLSYYRHFLSGNFYRESCYQCPYARMKRVADITVGDYWGIDTEHADEFASGTLPRRNDWSCLLVNTDKGRKFLAAHGGELMLYPTAPEKIARGNAQLNAPSQRLAIRSALRDLYVSGGYKAIEKNFLRNHGGSLRYHARLMKRLITGK